MWRDSHYSTRRLCVISNREYKTRYSGIKKKKKAHSANEREHNNIYLNAVDKVIFRFVLLIISQSPIKWMSKKRTTFGVCARNSLHKRQKSKLCHEFRMIFSLSLAQLHPLSSACVAWFFVIYLLLYLDKQLLLLLQVKKKVVMKWVTAVCAVCVHWERAKMHAYKNICTSLEQRKWRKREQSITSVLNFVE